MTSAAFFDLDKTLWACSGRKAVAGEAVETWTEACTAYFCTHLSRSLFPAMLDCVKSHRQAGNKTPPFLR